MSLVLHCSILMHTSSPYIETCQIVYPAHVSLYLNLSLHIQTTQIMYFTTVLFLLAEHCHSDMVHKINKEIVCDSTQFSSQ